MTNAHSLRNTQLNTWMVLGGFVVPLLGIFPACIAFVVNNFPPDAPVRNPYFRIGAVVVAVGAGLAIRRYASESFPKEIALGDDEITVTYMKKTVVRPYCDVETASLHDRNFTVGGRGTGSIPLTVDETIFTLSFHEGPTVKMSVVPARDVGFFEMLGERLAACSEHAAAGAR